jgi:hypothetical protein
VRPRYTSESRRLDRFARTLRGLNASMRLIVEYRVLLLGEQGKSTVQFTVGFKHLGNTGHLVVEAEDALIAALKVKMRHPEALVRRVNKRGDQRHPERDFEQADEKR